MLPELTVRYALWKRVCVSRGELSKEFEKCYKMHKDMKKEESNVCSQMFLRLINALACCVRLVESEIERHWTEEL